MSDTNKGLLLGLIGVVLAVFATLYIAKPNYNKMQTMKTENVQLKARLAELNEKQADRQRYIDEKDEYDGEYEDYLNRFPADINQEITIMFLEGIKDSNDFMVDSLELGHKEQFYTLGIGGGDVALDGAAPTEETAEGTETTDTAEATEAPAETGAAEVGVASSEYNATYDCYRAVFPISYSGSYEAIKNVVAYVDNYSDRMTVDHVDVAYEADKDVYTGTIQMLCYSVEGQDRPERTVDLNSVETGVDNIFDTGYVPEGESAAGLSAYDENDGSAIESSYDFYAMLNPATGDVSAKVVGQNGTGKDASIISDSEDKVSVLAYEFYEKDGKTYCKYTLDNATSYEAEVTSAEDIKVLLKSSARKDDSDKVGVKVTISNTSSLPVYVKVSGDDSASPRVSITSTSGSVKVYK